MPAEYILWYIFVFFCRTCSSLLCLICQKVLAHLGLHVQYSSLYWSFTSLHPLSIYIIFTHKFTNWSASQMSYCLFGCSCQLWHSDLLEIVFPSVKKQFCFCPVYPVGYRRPRHEQPSHSVPLLCRSDVRNQPHILIWLSPLALCQK